MKKQYKGKKGILLGMFALLVLGQITSVKNVNTVYAQNVVDAVLPTEENGESEVTETPTPTPAEEIVSTVIFNGNGGTFPQNGGGSTAIFEFTQKDIEELSNYKLYRSDFPAPVRNGYTLKEWRNPETGRRIGNTITVKPGKKITLNAQWTLNNYTIQYHINGGAFTSGSNRTSKYNVNSADIKLPDAQKKGNRFGGWYTNSTFQGKAVTSIPKGSTGNINLYAKWISAAPAKVEFDTISTKKKQLTIKLKRAFNAKAYYIVISTDKNFSKGKTVTYAMGGSVKLTIPQIAKGNYYIKACAYAYDDFGNICYGKYSDVQKASVTSSVKEYKATSNSAKITAAKAATAEQVTVKATINKQIKSSDDFYYLVKVNPYNDKPVKALSKVFKGKKVAFHLDTEDKVNVVSKFAVAIKQNGNYKIISKATYITNPEKTAFNKMEYVKPASKKGIHGANDVNLGAKNTMCNINLNDLITTKGNGTAYVYNGKTYYFSNTQQGYVRECNAHNVSVTVMLYLPWDASHTYLIHPSGRSKGYYYYGLNTVDEKARETLEAAFCYLGESFGQEDCYVSNWVLGNEVNSQQMWNHVGNLSLNDYSKSYAQAFQMLSYAVKSSYANARIFIPIDNAWAIPVSKMGWNGKTFLSAFDTALKKESPKTKWNLAYHAYSYPLTTTAYASNQHVTRSEHSPYVTMKNIEVLTNYIKKHYGTKTRIILSEQGYTADLGESAQAASIAYGYYKAEFNSMIDAFIIRSQYDHAGEAAQGLSMGLSSTSTKHRQAYTVFKYMDTPQSEKYTKKYLKTIGAKNWKSIIPGYSASKFKKMNK